MYNIQKNLSGFCTLLKEKKNNTDVGVMSFLVMCDYACVLNMYELYYHR